MVVGPMSDASAYGAGDGASEIDPDELLKELRRQISDIRAQMQAHRETMLAAGLTGVAPAEPASFAPRADARERTKP